MNIGAINHAKRALRVRGDSAHFMSLGGAMKVERIIMVPIIERNGVWLTVGINQSKHAFMVLL